MYSYPEIVDYLFKLERRGIDFSLERISTLLSYFGNPHLSLKAFHIGGTNGKGSTSAILANILKEAGYRVGLYTSPHLSLLEERFQINGEMISRDDLVEYACRVREKIEKFSIKLTFFEFLTAVAFLYFRERNVDAAVIEVGMGGRLDATNLVNPIVSIITNISLDHMDYLGSTIKAIAKEKSGIIKDNIPVVLGEIDQEVLDLITKELRPKNRYYIWQKDFRAEEVSDRRFNYFGIEKDLIDMKISLKGYHQYINASLAICALECTSNIFYTPESAIRKGLESIIWPGRLEYIEGNIKIIMDCAHNPHGIRYAIEYILSRVRFKRIFLIMGVMKDKDYPAMIKMIAPHCYKIIFTKVDIPRAASPGELAHYARNINKNTVITQSVRDSIELAVKEVDGDDLIFITGSIYVVGEARKILPEYLR